jgi:methylmalonyl-CoA/ethylmalonyl-CoA epimerase
MRALAQPRGLIMTSHQSRTSPITGIAQIALTVRDLDRADAFYRDVLGLRHLFRAPPGMSFFDCGGIRLMLALPETGEEGKIGSLIYYRVEDIAAARDAIAARGGEFEQEPHKIADLGDRELWLAFLRDPEGNLVGLMSEVVKP